MSEILDADKGLVDVRMWLGVFYLPHVPCIALKPILHDLRVYYFSSSPVCSVACTTTSPCLLTLRTSLIKSWLAARRWRLVIVCKWLPDVGGLFRAADFKTLMSCVQLTAGYWRVVSVYRFSPYEWRNRSYRYDRVVKYDFDLCNSFWFSMGALMLQGSDHCPRYLLPDF